MELTDRIVDMLLSKDREMVELGESLIDSTEYKFSWTTKGDGYKVTFPKYIDRETMIRLLKRELREVGSLNFITVTREIKETNNKN